MTKPNISPEWAESAAPGDVAYPTSKQAGGYQVGDTIEHDEYNALWQTHGEWINYLRDGNGGLEPSLRAASLTSPTDGEIFVIAPTDADLYPTGSLGAIAGVDDITQIATNGTHYAYVTFDGANYRLNVRDGEAPSSPVSISSPLAGAVVDLVMNEDGIFLTIGTAIQYFGFNAIPKDSQAPGSVAVALTAATDRIYVGDGNELYELVYDDSGFLSYTSIYNHGAGITSICTDGTRIFVSANANGSSETLVGITTSSASVLWTTTSSSVPTAAGTKRLVCDGRCLYLAKEADNLYKIRALSGIVMDTVAMPGTTSADVAVTDDDVWVCVPGLGMHVVSKAFDDIRFSRSTTLTGYSNSPKHLAASGTKLFMGGDAHVSGFMGAILQLKSTPAKFRYRKGAYAYSPNGLNWHSLDLDKGY